MKVYSGKDLLILGMKVEGLGKEENFVETWRLQPRGEFYVLGLSWFSEASKTVTVQLDTGWLNWEVQSKETSRQDMQIFGIESQVPEYAVTEPLSQDCPWVWLSLDRGKAMQRWPHKNIKETTSISCTDLETWGKVNE
jgi:hypothetical protein